MTDALAAISDMQFPGGPAAAVLLGIVIGTFIGMFIRRKR
jgi:hypothetical protein